MKIYSYENLPPVGPAGAAKPSGRASENGFADVLAKAVGDTPEAVKGMAPAAGVQPVETPLAPVNEVSIVSRTNGLLDALEGYASALGDDAVSLKEIEPMVNDMAEKAHALYQELGRDAEGDLGELARNTVHQAQAEVIKYRRGDYV